MFGELFAIGANRTPARVGRNQGRRRGGRRIGETAEAIRRGRSDVDRNVPGAGAVGESSLNILDGAFAAGAGDIADRPETERRIGGARDFPAFVLVVVGCAFNIDLKGRDSLSGG